MTNFKWRCIDDLNRPWFLTPNDRCMYAREHVKGGYKVSFSNKYLFNFKKPMKDVKENDYFRQVKTESIEKYAEELGKLKLEKNAVLIPAATSIPQNHPDFDSRLHTTLDILQEKYRPDLIIHKILDVKEKVPTAHSEGGSRNINIIMRNVTLLDTPEIIPELIFLVDDLLTTGGHFKAYKNILQKAYPNKEIIGIMWGLHLFD